MGHKSGCVLFFSELNYMVCGVASRWHKKRKEHCDQVGGIWKIETT